MLDHSIAAGEFSILPTNPGRGRAAAVAATQSTGWVKGGYQPPVGV